jgi:oxaloacetate decarboxylase gamma subunit
MERDILLQGLELMLFGMGTVVVFLALLVVCTGAMSRLIARYFPEPPAPAAPVPAVPRQAAPGRPAGAATGDAIDPHLAAVIAAAVHAHRSRRR